MLFNSLPFAIFMLGLLLATRALPRRAELGLLLAASLLFYSLWHPVYLLLLLAEVGVNYGLIRLMARGEHRRLYLGLSIGFTLFLLAWFKYAAMAVETLLPALRGVGLEVEVPNFFLPLGISFYSFQIIALSVDLYRGDVKKTPSLSQYALFVSFFPQLIAGPIVRGHELLPQIAAGGRVSAERNRRGIWLLTSGLFKKVVMGDFLLAGFVDSVFAGSGVGGGGVHLVAMYSFAFQIYFDFSGYTDMARGLALLLGYELPLNFKEPYLSRDPSEFWRRWHITLSAWLRDYLYIPLGGNRLGNARTYVNLFLTMLLGGLWHGAAWTFVIWGSIHGLLLLLHRALGRRDDADRPIGWADVPRIVILFNVVCIAWIFFREDDLDAALRFVSTIFAGSYEHGLPPLETAVVVLSAALHPLERYVRAHQARIMEVFGRTGWGSLAEGAAVGAVVALALAASGSGGEFIYFQF